MDDQLRPTTQIPSPGNGTDAHVRAAATPPAQAARRVGFNRWQSVCMRLICAVVVAGSSACAPTVRVAADEPITINLAVNIRHEILIRVDDELESLFADEKGLY